MGAPIQNFPASACTVPRKAGKEISRHTGVDTREKKDIWHSSERRPTPRSVLGRPAVWKFPLRVDAEIYGCQGKNNHPGRNRTCLASLNDSASTIQDRMWAIKVRLCKNGMASRKSPWGRVVSW